MSRFSLSQRFGAVIVDDNTLLMMDAMDLAEEAGLVSYGARNADEAIRLLETQSDIRILFTDVQMSGSMDGYRLAATVRERWPLVRIIVTSGVRPPQADDLPEDSLFFFKPYPHNAVVDAMAQMTH
ncbi:response regulator [Aureimonas ureilytica]|uniref:response regulator n=1 Tax=Aureimonas ureilytica TaxID=401562 RepID=UPI000363ABB7|nr:response regulator [Aureimonas ureilytica]